MKVLLFLPFAPDSPTGNAVTARRIRKNLAPLDVDVVLQHLPAHTRLDDVLAVIDDEQPDVLQWYNAWKTGRWAPEVGRARDVPSVITLTGTDINREAEDPAHCQAVLDTLRQARAVVTYSPALRDHAVAFAPDIAETIHVLPKGVELGTATYDLPSWAEGDVTLFLLPAGLRPEKDNRFAVRALDKVHTADPRVRLLLAGPAIDVGYAAALKQDLERRPWAGHVEEIPHEAMASVYAPAAVVLNTSQSEGLANAVLEGMACGRPVLASDIEGNRQVVEDGETGLLYRDEADFVAKARLLASDQALRERLGAAAREQAARRFSPAAEAEELHRVLMRVRGEALGMRLIQGGSTEAPPPARQAPPRGRSKQVPAQRLRQVKEFLKTTSQELDNDLRSMLHLNPALNMRSPDAEAYDPREAPPEPPTFDGAGKILESRSPRIGADHAGYLIGAEIARDRADIAGKVVWEVGCGSGVLAALCAKLGAREVWGTDVDDEALGLAAETARLNGVRVRVAKASLMALDGVPRPDVVVANLPQKPVPPGMRLPVANDGGPDGTRLLVPFLKQAADRMPPGARLYFLHHSLAWASPIHEVLVRSFDVLRVATRQRIFYEDEFPRLLPYWRSRREAGLCTFDDLGKGRFAFLCAAVTCVRR